MEEQRPIAQAPDKLVNVDDYNNLLDECVEIQKEDIAQQAEAGKSAFDQVEELEEILAEQISAFALRCYAAELLVALLVFVIFVVVQAAGVRGVGAKEASEQLKERLGTRYAYYKAIEDFSKNLGAAAKERHPEKISDALMVVNSAFDREGAAAAAESGQSETQFLSEKLRIRDKRVWYEVGSSAGPSK